MAYKSKTLKNSPLPVLPIDVLVIELLPKLPPRSLIRFKCVSKFFRTYISSKEFVDLHLRQSSSTNTHRCLVLQDDDRRSLYTFDLDSAHPCVTKLPCLKSLDVNKDIVFVGSCNGLICFVNVSNNNEEELVILNPSTGMYKKSNIPTKPSEINTTSSVTFGFGYDTINDDYKVVGYNENFSMIKNNDNDHNNFVIVSVMLYSVKSNYWRCIEKKHTLCGVYSSCPNFGVLLKNNLVHWMFECTTHKRPRLCCFNLENEQWTTEVPLPEFEYWENLRVINDYLGLFTRDETHRYLWVMKQYGLVESWVKLISVSHSPRTCLLDTAISAYRRETRREELLVKVRPASHHDPGDKVYCWYNEKDGTYTRLEGIPQNFNVLASSLESLVSVV